MFTAPPPTPVLLNTAVLRPWRAEDAPLLAQLANDESVARNMRDAFPHPYGMEHAERWIAIATAQPNWLLAIETGGALAGGIGLHPFDDVYRLGAEIGYWLAPPCWGRGIATEAVRALAEMAFYYTDLVRLQAGVFSYNPASMRVLEKAGFYLEGVRRSAVLKGDALCDEHLYARLRL